MEQQHKNTVVLADAHAITRQGIAALCTSDGLKVVGECSDGEAAFEMIDHLKPDVAIIEIQMPGMTGIEVISKLRTAGCTTKLMVLSVLRDETTVQDALRAGADAYLLKGGQSCHLAEAITFVLAGGVWTSPLLRGAGLFTRREQQDSQGPLASLSPREMEVFRYLVNGLRAKDIADRLEISPKTVDLYRATVMRKLNVPDLLSLVKFWLDTLGDETAGVHSNLGPRLPHRPPRAAAAEPPEDAQYRIK